MLTNSPYIKYEKNGTENNIVRFCGETIIFSRPCFKWANSLSSELIIKMSKEHPNCCEKCILKQSNYIKQK